MSIVVKDSYKADIYNFEMEKFGSLLNLTINNVISWEWMKFKFTKEELRGLADFLNQFIEENK